MSPEEIATAFAEAAEDFPACVGRPDIAYVQDLREKIATVLVEIPFDLTSGEDNLIALVISDQEYQTTFNRSFVVPPKVGVYDKSLADGTVGVAKSRAEATHEAKRTDRATFDAAVRGARKFIIDKVEDTWIRTLRDATFAYSRVPCRRLLAALETNAPGTHAPDRIKLINSMQEFYDKAAGIPEYINMLEDAQKRALQINQRKPITDETLVDIASAAVLASGRFERADEDWDKLAPDDQTWDQWKPIYLEAHERLRAREAAQGGSNSFGGANAATDAEEAEPEEAAATLGELEACMDTLACAARTDAATLSELVKSNASLTTANAKLSAEVTRVSKINRHLHGELKRALVAAGAPPPPALENMGKGRRSQRPKKGDKANEAEETAGT